MRAGGPATKPRSAGLFRGSASAVGFSEIPKFRSRSRRERPFHAAFRRFERRLPHGGKNGRRNQEKNDVLDLSQHAPKDGRHAGSGQLRQPQRVRREGAPILHRLSGIEQRRGLSLRGAGGADLRHPHRQRQPHPLPAVQVVRRAEHDLPHGRRTFPGGRDRPARPPRLRGAGGHGDQRADQLRQRAGYVQRDTPTDDAWPE